MAARCFCHELGHLEGQMYDELTDRLYTEEELDAMEEERTGKPIKRRGRRRRRK